jgi:two-component system alkaline phosphatase synthesis response regulator PhoP
MKKNTHTVLCVDDNIDTCELVRLMFEGDGYKVVTCQDGQEAIRLIRYENFDAVVLDYLMPEIDGMDVCRAIRTFNKNVPVVFFTASARENDRVAILASGAQAFLVKPNDLNILTETVFRLVEQKESTISAG